MRYKRLAADYEAWTVELRKELKGVDPARLTTELDGDLEVHPLYTDLSVNNIDQSWDPGFPGLPPYVRGPYASMYTVRPWTIRQYAGFSTAEESNAFYKRNLAAGQQGLSVAFDLATHRGYDSDHPRVTGDVGMAGVAIDSVEDMKILFDGIPLDKVSVSMTMNGAVLPVLAAFIVAAEEQGVPREKLSGTIQNDILKEFMVRNTFIYPPAPSMRIVGDIIEYCSLHMPKFNSISISGYHIQEAGANPVLELAFTIADGVEYVQTALARGLKIDDFAPRLSFFFGIGMDFFTEICKLRAARFLWWREMSKLHPQNSNSLKLRTHCQTSGLSLVEQDPLNNIMRTAYEALAAALGGTQSLHTNAYDEALALPTELSARVARNTQLVLQNETGVTRVVDPLGGSYYVEALTRELVGRASEILDEANRLGGMTRAIEQGWPQQQIQEAAARRKARIDNGDQVIVGVNEFRLEKEKPIKVRRINNRAVLKKQVRRLKQIRSTRDGAKVQAALDALTLAAQNGTDNLLTLSIEAIRLRATVGEVSDALEKVYSRYVPNKAPVTGIYGALLAQDEHWKQVREQVLQFERDHGRRPRILIAKLGQDGHDHGAQVIATSFADLGFVVDMGALFSTPAEAARQAVLADVHVIGVSSLAAGHRTLVPEIIAQLQAQGANNIAVVVGGVIPPDDYAFLREAGVKGIFGPGTRISVAAEGVLNAISPAK